MVPSSDIAVGPGPAGLGGGGGGLVRGGDRGGTDAAKQPLRGRAKHGSENVPHGEARAVDARLDVEDRDVGDRDALDSGIGDESGELPGGELPDVSGFTKSGGGVHESQLSEAEQLAQVKTLNALAGAEAKRRRGLAGLSLRAMADKAGLSHVRITQLEGGAPWSVENMVSFGAALGCDPLSFLLAARLTSEELAVVEAMRRRDPEPIMKAALAAVAKG